MMARLTAGVVRAFNMLRQRSLDEDAKQEMASHLAFSAEALERRGIPAADARRRAIAALGGIEATIERQRDEYGLPWLAAALQDARYALRSAVTHPGYTFLVVVTLGLGIGANTAIFSVVRGVLLRPLPYADGDRLVQVRESRPLAPRTDALVAIPELYDYRASAHSVEHLVEYHQMTFDLLNRGEPRRVSTGVVSHDFFPILGIQPLLGRTFVAGDDEPGAAAVLVLSYAYWQKQFGGDRGVLGQVFEMNDRPHTVVGVLPDVPQYPQDNDVYMSVSACPFRAAAEKTIASSRRAFPVLTVFGRLAPGATAPQAASEIRTIADRFVHESPQAYPRELGFAATTLSVQNEMTKNARPLLLLLLGTAALVLLIACADVANLLLARLLRRQQELELRASLGASHSRLARQLLTESAVFAVGGGVLGIVFAASTLRALTAFVARFTPRASEVHLDASVLVFTTLIALGTGLLVGTLPASRRFGVDDTRLKTAGTGNRTIAGSRWQATFVVIQVALSLVLLVGAGLLLGSFYRLQRVDAGYRPQHVLSADVFNSRAINPGAQLPFLRRLLDRLDRTQGIAAVAITNAVPLQTLRPAPTPLAISGLDADPNRRPSADVRIISSGYFDTIGVPLIDGRYFTDADAADAEPVVVVSHAAARLWRGTGVVNSRVSLDGGQTWRRVVGVVGDVKQFGLSSDAVEQLYLPLPQAANGIAGARVLIRTIGDPASAAGLVRDAVHELDPTMPVENIRSLEDLRDAYLAGPYLTALLLTLFAGLALALTLAGIGGVIALSVTQRTPEFGIRIALGATRASVLRSVLLQGLKPVALGITIGSAGAVAASRILGAWLFETAPTDPVVFAATAGLILLTGTLACLAPAWRATRVAPMLALKNA